MDIRDRLEGRRDLLPRNAETRQLPLHALDEDLLFLIGVLADRS